MNYNYGGVLALPPDQLAANFLAALGGVDAQIAYAGPHSLVVTRRYTPGWAIGLGILGLLVFLLGIILFFVKTTETLSISIAPVPGGSRTLISGESSKAVISRINAVVGASPPATLPPPPVN